MLSKFNKISRSHLLISLILLLVFGTGTIKAPTFKQTAKSPGFIHATNKLDTFSCEVSTLKICCSGAVHTGNILQDYKSKSATRFPLTHPFDATPVTSEAVNTEKDSPADVLGYFYEDIAASGSTPNPTEFTLTVATNSLKTRMYIKDSAGTIDEAKDDFILKGNHRMIVKDGVLFYSGFYAFVYNIDVRSPPSPLDHSGKRACYDESSFTSLFYASGNDAFYSAYDGRKISKFPLGKRLYTTTENGVSEDIITNLPATCKPKNLAKIDESPKALVECLPETGSLFLSFMDLANDAELGMADRTGDIGTQVSVAKSFKAIGTTKFAVMVTVADFATVTSTKMWMINASGSDLTSATAVIPYEEITLDVKEGDSDTETYTITSIVDAGTNDDIKDFSVFVSGFTGGDKGFGRYLRLGYGECHESCSECSLLGNEDHCTGCPEGFMIKDDADEGKCVEEVVDESLKNLPVAQCGTKAIPGCLKCSEAEGETEKCVSCVSGGGLDKYNDNFTAGKSCVICPVEDCKACELKDGDTERKCSECFSGKSLGEIDGKQVCSYGFIGPVSLIIMWVLFEG